MQPIDIVITYLNSQDDQWQKDYNYYKSLEIKTKIHKETDQQSFGAERTREWDNLRYWFRGVEKNCSWVNKIFFIVQNERHVPKWLDITNPKLRIVYHDEFIPKELLPTFNALVIAFYISNIPDLSENYITCDDDMFFINPVAANEFFNQDDSVVLDIRKLPYKLGNKNEWEKIMNNNILFLHKFMTKESECSFSYSHLPDPTNKSTTNKLITENYALFFNSFKQSKFRATSNYQRFIFVDFPKIGKNEKHTTRVDNSRHIQYTSKTNLMNYSNYKIICVNDSEDLDNSNICKNNLLAFLHLKFPDKSAFELSDYSPDKAIIDNFKNKYIKIKAKTTTTNKQKQTNDYYLYF